VVDRACRRWSRFDGGVRDIRHAGLRPTPGTRVTADRGFIPRIHVPRRHARSRRISGLQRRHVLKPRTALSGPGRSPACRTLRTLAAHRARCDGIAGMNGSQAAFGDCDGANGHPRRMRFVRRVRDARHVALRGDSDRAVRGFVACMPRRATDQRCGDHDKAWLHDSHRRPCASIARHTTLRFALSTSPLTVTGSTRTPWRPDDTAPRLGG